MYNVSLRNYTESFIEKIDAKAKTEMEGVPEEKKPKNVDVFLELVDKGWVYYMVDLDKRALFWLEKYDATWMADSLNGIEDKSQLCELTYLYLIRRCRGLFK